MGPLDPARASTPLVDSDSAAGYPERKRYCLGTGAGSWSERQPAPEQEHSLTEIDRKGPADQTANDDQLPDKVSAGPFPGSDPPSAQAGDEPRVDRPTGSARTERTGAQWWSCGQLGSSGSRRSSTMWVATSRSLVLLDWETRMR